MLMLHKMTNRIRISQGYPPSELVKTMRPFLKLYLLERYSFSSMTRKYAGKQVSMELRQFADKNPNFGTRIPIQFVPPLNYNPFSPNQQYIAKSGSFVTATESYKNYCESRYLTTHVYDDNTFENYVETGDSLQTYNGQEEPEEYPRLIPIPEPEPEMASNWQSERIQEHALAILSRLGRTPSAIATRNVNPVVMNQMFNNYISNVEEPNNDDEEIINTSPYDQEESEMELDNEYDDDGEDSVS